MTVPVNLAYAAAANALKASGTIVKVEPRDFVGIVGRCSDPLVVVSHEGVFWKQYRYLTSYKGLAFHAVSPTPLALPKAEVITAKGISVPET